MTSDLEGNPKFQDMMAIVYSGPKDTQGHLMTISKDAQFIDEEPGFWSRWGGFGSTQYTKVKVLGDDGKTWKIRWVDNKYLISPRKGGGSSKTELQMIDHTPGFNPPFSTTTDGAFMEPDNQTESHEGYVEQDANGGLHGGFMPYRDSLKVLGSWILEGNNNGEHILR